MDENELIESEPVVVPAYKFIDTMESYSQSMFVRVETNSGGSKCVFCNKKTSFDNRHVCPECWKLYKDEVLFGLKQNISDVEIKIV